MCVCMHRSDRPPRHERTRGTRSPTFTFTLTFTLAPGSRGCIGSRRMPGLSRASRPHTIVMRSAMARRRGTMERLRAASSCCNFQRPRRAALFSSEKCLPCAIDAHRPLSSRPCRLTCAGPGNYPSRATGLRAIAAVKGWRDLPFKFREEGGRKGQDAYCDV